MPQKLDLDSIIAQLNIEEFFGLQGVTFARKTGKGWYGNCPFCGEQKKFSAQGEDGPKKGLWQCYKCKEKGNAITFYAKLNNCSNGDAVAAMKKQLGIEDEAPWTNNVVPLKSAMPLKASRASGVSSNVPPEAQDVLTNSAQEGSGPSEEAENSDTARVAVRPRDIYAHLVRVTALSDAHRQELRSKRGLQDAIIDRLAFRSGGEHLVDIINGMRETFSDADLHAAGLLHEVNGVMAYNQQLLEDRVLIPYLDEHGEVYFLRPHKLGFAKQAIHPYCRYLLKEHHEDVVLTEGEFKGAALHQWGIPGFGVPGVSSFAGKHIDRLIELLNEFGVKRVTVIFDNEIKDNPEFKNYKQKPEDRYDTEFWAYILSYKLGRNGFVVRIGTLPDEWREDGKIDFDGALAAGHTRDEILRVIDQAKTPNEFLDSLPEAARRIVQRKKARQFTNVPISREFNKYVATRAKGDNKWQETISNFVINIKSSFFTPDGVIRNVQLVNEYGEWSDTFPLSPADMAGLNEFKKFCFGKGNFVFEGTTQDLLNVWKLEFLRDIGDLIYMPDRIGLVENKLWLFGNMAIKDGEVIRPDNDGIMWVAGKGYKPQSLQIGSRGEAIEDSIPALSEKPIDLVDLAKKMKQTIGGYEAYTGIGWVIATIFSEDIFQAYKCMPILFPHGKRESGKTTFMRWLMAFFGVETEGSGIAETTQNFIARALSYNSSIGAWFDEYRNEHKVIQKDGFFRSAYNRQLSGKGTATAFQAKGFSVHAAVAISGEELPKDNGLFTRLISLQISSYKRDREWFDWVNRHQHSFSYLTYYLITHYDELRPKILANIRELKMALLKQDVSDRTAENWAICAGAFDAVILQDAEYIRWIGETCQEIKQTGESEHMLNQFWGDVSYLVSENKLDINHVKVEGDRLHLWLGGAYGAWATYYRQKTGREPFDEHSIRKYIQDEPYFLKLDRTYFGKSNQHTRRRGFVLDINKAPEVVQEVAESVGGGTLWIGNLEEG